MVGKLVACAAGMALMLGTPVAAQETGNAEAEENLLSSVMAAFPVEPLSEEQEARLPLAQTIVDRIIPPGSLGEMMGSMFDQFMAPIMQMATAAPRGEVARQLAISPGEIELGDEQVAEAADILDPVRIERSERTMAVMPVLMGRMMDAMEPSMRKAMAEAYAINFTDRELADIDAFFSTETGISYARKSFALASDPRIMAASMESLPAIMGSIGELETEMAAAVADLPEPRTFAQLSAQERTRLAELLGWSVEELEANMLVAEELAIEGEADSGF